MKLLAASMAAAALLQSGSADAKVIFEKAQTKKLFQAVPEEPKKAAQAVTKEAKKAAGEFKLPSISAPSVTTSGGDIDPRTVALPGAIIAILGGGFALSKIDPGFAEMMSEASSKDSTSFAGYEQSLKNVAAKADPKTLLKRPANKSGKKTSASPKAGGIRGLFGK